MTRDSTRQLSPSFRVREFACKGSDVVLIDDELVVLLQCIREHFGKPVTYHQRLPHRRAQRRRGRQQVAASTCWAGQRTSTSKVCRWLTVAAYAESLASRAAAASGRYPKDAKHPKRMTGWVHIDTRTNKSRWKG